MNLDTISIYEQAKLEQKDIKNPSFWKNEIINYIEKIKTDMLKLKTDMLKRKSISTEKEEEMINDTRKNIQNLAKQAKSSCIHQKNKRKMSFEEKEIPKEIQKEIQYYKRLEEKRRRLEQACIRWAKKRAVKTLINWNLLKNLINQPENNRFEYKSKVSKKIYDVMVLEKETANDRTTYQLETTEGKPFKFAVTIDKNQEENFFQASKNTSTIEWLQEIEDIIYNFLNKIPW